MCLYQFHGLNDFMGIRPELIVYNPDALLNYQFSKLLKVSYMKTKKFDWNGRLFQTSCLFYETVDQFFVHYNLQ